MKPPLWARIFLSIVNFPFNLIWGKDMLYSSYDIPFAQFEEDFHRSTKAFHQAYKQQDIKAMEKEKLHLECNCLMLIMKMKRLKKLDKKGMLNNKESL